MKIPVVYNVRSVLRRPVTSLATALGIAFVVVTFVGMLALAQGFRAAMLSTGHPDNLFVLRKGADAEISSGIEREEAAILRSYPEVARLPDGRPMATADVYVVVAKPRLDGSETHMPVRGVGPEATAVRDEVRIVEGRMFDPGRAEVVVGKGLVGRMQDVALGERLRFGQQEFTVVGHFEAGGGAFESEVWGDAEELMSVFRGPVYQSMALRLADPAAFDAVEARIEGDPRLQLDVERESDFFAEQSAFLGTVLRLVAFFVTGIMAVGAVFGAVNTMDAMVAARSREIALLQTLGFKPRSVLASFLLEALFIALVGGVLGALLALPINGIRTSTTNWQSFGELTFAFRVTPSILLQGLLFAAVMGLVGGFLPARRAAKQVVAAGLRRE
ncbi:MAG TPA: ABC transporter permease [Longimicrobiales bacterium]|nr:ABC transporter permease [Longimicrobiales bacterium]